MHLQRNYHSGGNVDAERETGYVINKDSVRIRFAMPKGYSPRYYTVTITADECRAYLAWMDARQLQAIAREKFK